MWGDQTCQRFEATAVGFETGLRVRPSNRYAIAPHYLIWHTPNFVQISLNFNCIHLWIVFTLKMCLYTMTFVFV